ncbi:hypothetical protein QTP88_001792 [Uroleucon formosanum]
MNLDQFCELMRSANEKQTELLLHVINHVLCREKSPLQIFFTGPAGCGKTFVIKLIMEIYNRFSNNDGFCNSFITCASTGKAAVAINGTTVHTALKISLSKLLPLSMETAQQYRCLFKYVKVLIIDEVSMIGAEHLNQIDVRLKQITGNFDEPFGRLDAIFIGDLRQLPPVRATPIYKLESIAMDVISGCKNHEQEAFVRQKMHKMSVIDTGGLPYDIIFVIGKPYIITTNIDVADGLANGAVRKLVYIEQNVDNQITRVWLVFADQKTGMAAKRKAAAYVTEHIIDKRAVPITRRTSSISLNNNKIILAKRNHFSLIPGCAMTIHKSQGGTYDEIVYEYNKSHSVQLFYVALTRVKTIDGLYMCTHNDDLRFYHGRRADPSIVSLQEEFKRLSLNRLTTLQTDITNFMTSREGLTIIL